MNIKTQVGKIVKSQSHLIALAVFKEEIAKPSPLLKEIDKALNSAVSNALKQKSFKGNKNESVYFSTLGNLSADYVVLVGLGEKKKADLEVQRLAAKAVMSRAKSLKAKSIAYQLESLPDFDASQTSQAFVEGALLSSYQFEKESLRTVKKTKSNQADVFNVGQIELWATQASQVNSAKAGIRFGQAVSEAVNQIRTLVYMPANFLTPTRLSQEAAKVAKKYPKLKIKILDEAEMKKLGMNSLLGVGQGSSEASKLIVLEYQGAGTAEKVGLVGKGVTFDTGGISIKPSRGMKEMTGDMGGAACVLGSMIAIAELGLKKNVVGVIPTVENMPDGKAQRPGDVVTAMNGKTIEVINTDAEGRLILCDAMVYAQQKLGVKKMIDFATLTGGVVIALGHLNSGVISNDDSFCQQWIEASQKTGERMWRLPADEEYFDLLKSDVADMMNCLEGGEASTITAGKFLEQFVEEKTKWIHVDIAGTSDINRPQGVFSKGPTGVGVRTVIQYLRDY